MSTSESAAPLPEPAPASPPGRPRSFSCPNCGGAVILRAVGQSITATCGQCSSLIDVADERLRIIQEARARMVPAALPIGARGRLQDREWEIVGFMRRTDGTGEFRWIEYLLFNPRYGYRFLVEEQGHWTLVRMLNRDVPGAGRKHGVSDGRRFYRFFGKNRVKTVYVAGEFYWRASADDVSIATDYIAPPYRLMVEQNGEEIIVSEGEYIAASAVSAAFKTKLSNPPSFSAGACQVNPRGGGIRVGLIGLAAATVMQFVTLGMASNEELNKQSYNLSAADKGKTLASQDFTLKSEDNVEISSLTALDNDWLEVDISLVNTQTNQTWPVSQAIEHYTGYDSDGRWEEGSNVAQTLIAGVPPGTYKLLIEPDAGLFARAQSAQQAPNFLAIMRQLGTTGAAAPAVAPPVLPSTLPSLPLTISVTRGVPVWSNYFIAVLLLLAVPGIGLLRYSMFEQARWKNGGVAEEFEGKEP